MIQIVAQFAPIARAAIGSHENIVKFAGPTESFVRVWPTRDSATMTPTVLRTTIVTAALTAGYRMIWDSAHLPGLSQSHFAS